jgi:hypothetical protein
VILENHNMPGDFYQPGDAGVVQRRIECLDLTVLHFNLTPRELKIIKNVRAQWVSHEMLAQQCFGNDTVKE